LHPLRPRGWRPRSACWRYKGFFGWTWCKLRTQYRFERQSIITIAASLAVVPVGTYIVLVGTLEHIMAVLEDIKSESARIAHVLGLSPTKPISNQILARRVAAGLPPRTAKVLARCIDPKGLIVVATDIVPKTTLHNNTKSKRNLSKDHSEVIYVLGKVVAESFRLLRDPEKVLTFLTKPHPMLEGDSPFELAKSSVAGAEVVMNLLANADAGTAV
jgi:putative toxin-antitoxin system antitoxin component (TIGR02293 family)